MIHLKAVKLAYLTGHPWLTRVDQAHHGIQQVRGTPPLAYSFPPHRMIYAN